MSLIINSHKGDPFEKIGSLLNEFNHLQIVIDSKIASYLKISDFNKTILLHSSIIDFGGKIKLLKNFFKEKISTELISKLKKLNKIRNDLAHNLIEQGAHCEFDSGKLSAVVVSRKVNGFNHENGKLEEKDLDEMYSDFLRIFNEIRGDIEALN